MKSKIIEAKISLKKIVNILSCFGFYIEETTQACPECGCLTKHGLDKRKYRCEQCGYENPDRDIHSANMMVLLSGYGTYRSLNTDAVSTEKMIGFLNNLSNLGVVVTTNSMEVHQ